jgi:hypothetical protein
MVILKPSKDRLPFSPRMVRDGYKQNLGHPVNDLFRLGNIAVAVQASLWHETEASRSCSQPDRIFVNESRWPSRKGRPESGHQHSRKWARFGVTVAAKSSLSCKTPVSPIRKRQIDRRNGSKRFLLRSTNENGSTRTESCCRTNSPPKGF